MGKTRIKEKSWHTIDPFAFLGHLHSQTADEEQVRLNLAMASLPWHFPSWSTTNMHCIKRFFLSVTWNAAYSCGAVTRAVMLSWESEDSAHYLEFIRIWVLKLHCICSVHIGLYQRSSKKIIFGNYPELFSLRETNEALINFLSNTANWLLLQLC